MVRQGVALIADIVRSRELEDRAAAQQLIVDAFEQAHQHRPFQERPYATVGDEFQAVSADLAHALWASALVRLLLAKSVDCRFGIGVGDYREVAAGLTGRIQEGSAWERARAAVEEAHAREDKRSPYSRSWYRSDAADEALVNAQLLLRDQLIDRMSERESRLTAGLLLGRSQAEISRVEGISQSAVSQNLRRSGGAALVAADRVMLEGLERGVSA